METSICSQHAVLSIQLRSKSRLRSRSFHLHHPTKTTLLEYLHLFKQYLLSPPRCWRYSESHRSKCHSDRSQRLAWRTGRKRLDLVVIRRNTNDRAPSLNPLLSPSVLQLKYIFGTYLSTKNVRPFVRLQAYAFLIKYSLYRV